MGTITKTVFKVGDFVSWAQAGQLDLSPKFQRRPVWKKGAKSFLIDTILRGLPIPIVFLRDRVAVGSLVSRREVVDGQQRLRAVLGFISANLVKNFDPTIDEFKIARAHSKQLAGKGFDDLSEETRQRILGYEIPVHVFSSDTEDRDVLQIFARLNSTGVRLNEQELRNADYYGAFKTFSFETAYRYLPHWEKWGVFGDAAISRMHEVEEVSDLVISMHEGVHGKSQGKIDSYYKDYDTDYDDQPVVEARFDAVMDAIESSLGQNLKASEFSRQSMFHCLFLGVYEFLYGIAGPLQPRKAKKLPSGFSQQVLAQSQRLAAGDVSEELKKAIRGATADYGSRLNRLNFILEPFGRVFE